MMPINAPALLSGLAAASLRIAIVSFIGFAVLRLMQTRQPKLHRWVWGSTLLHGLMVVPLVVALPVLPPADSNLGSVASPASQLVISSDAARMQSVTPSPQPVGEQASWAEVLLVCWAAGCCLTCAIYALCWFNVARAARQSSMARARWQQELDLLRAKLQIRTSIALRVHTTLGPLLMRQIGWRHAPNRYVIIVPRSLWQGLSANQREAILRHELAHFERGDVWTSFAMRLIAVLHWFNPAAWWAVARFDEAAEWDCDRRVRNSSDVMGTSLATALLSIARPGPALRIGVSNARGSHIGQRVRKLVDNNVRGETNMKKLIIGGLVVGLFAFGLVRLRLTAQEMESQSPQRAAIAAKIESLAQALSSSEDRFTMRLASTLRSPAGSLVLQDAISEQSAELQREQLGGMVEQVLGKHFAVDAGKAYLLDENDPLRDELLATADASGEDLTSLTSACEKIAARLAGEDEPTLLVKRFLTQEVGPTYLYVNALRDRMRPGAAMLSETLGRVLVTDEDGRYHVRPDAREQLTGITAQTEEAIVVAERLHDELTFWASELVEDDPLHRRVKANVASPYFPGMILAEQIFERRQLQPGIVNKLLDQLDQLVEDTSRGLRIRDATKEEVLEVMVRFETINARIDSVRPARDALLEQLDLSEELTRKFKQLLETDIALVAVADGTEMANASTEQLVLALIGDAIVESGESLKLVDDDEARREIVEQLQQAFREFRSARRRAAPVRDLAAKLNDRELGDALSSIGGMLVIRRLVEQELASIQSEVFEQWQKEIFDTSSQPYRVRDDARPRIEEFLRRVEELESELSENDF